MQSVGIIWCSGSPDCAAQLQLHGLKGAVEDLGYRPRVIDYDPYGCPASRAASLEDGHGGAHFLAKSLLRRTAQLLGAQGDRVGVGPGECGGREQVARYQRFLDTELRLESRAYFSDAELKARPPECAAFIVGGDQAWRPVGPFKDSGYYLAFAETKKRIAYAPGIAAAQLPESYREWMRRRIRGIAHLSTAEENAASQIRQLTGREATVALDPVHLIDAGQWSRFAGEGRASSRPYLLCYSLGADSTLPRRAGELAKRHGLEMYLWSVNPGDRYDVGRLNPTHGDGPRDLVRLIRDAELVCTDSFHGTSLAILLNRPFFTFADDTRPGLSSSHSRLLSLLAVTGLQQRLVGKGDDLAGHPIEVDFAPVNCRLRGPRDASLAFLANALRSATG